MRPENVSTVFILLNVFLPKAKHTHKSHILTHSLCQFQMPSAHIVLIANVLVYAILVGESGVSNNQVSLSAAPHAQCLRIAAGNGS